MLPKPDRVLIKSSLLFRQKYFIVDRKHFLENKKCTMIYSDLNRLIIFFFCLFEPYCSLKRINSFINLFSNTYAISVDFPLIT